MDEVAPGFTPSSGIRTEPSVDGQPRGMGSGSPSVGPVLVQQKVMPPGLPKAVIARPRLHALYAELLNDHEALAVFAAAGSGKTVQAQLFADYRDSPLAWLTLDAGDRSPSRMLCYLAAALAPHVPGAQRALDRAFGQGAVLEEAAAVLAEEIEVPGLLVVIDQCETIADSAQSCSVLETFLNYLPAGSRAIVLSRTELPFSLGRLLLHGRVGRITDEDLGLTAEEAEQLVRARGEDLTEVDARWRAARGWVAGVAFGGAPRGGSRILSRDFDAYLGSEILDQLPPEERQFLLDTSILDAVSLRAAMALCGPGARSTWRRVALRHLPTTTSADWTIVYHPCFRDYLREQLALDDPDRLHRLRRRYADLLIESGQDEEAVELLLSLRQFEDALGPAERASRTVTDRGDWETLLRWIDPFTVEHVRSRPGLLAAQLKALRGARRLAEARALTRELEACGRLDAVIAAEPGVVAHIAWSMLWKPAEAMELLDRYDGGPEGAGVRYLLETTTLHEPAAAPPGGLCAETERVVSWGLMVQGRLAQLVAMLPDEEQWPPRSPYTTPHPLLGLVWRGELIRARELFDQVAEHIKQQVHTDFWDHVEAWLLLSEGDARRALGAAERSVLHSRRTGFGFEPVFQIAQAQALLALGRVDDAMEVLRRSIRASENAGLVAYVEWGEAFLGRALLLQDDNKGALELLSRAVTGMCRAERRLFLPMAAVYLAEAERRLGHLEPADAAADLAYDAAVKLGAFPVLQRALDDCPAVLRRQLTRDRAAAWRRIGCPEPIDGRGSRVRIAGPAVSVEVNPFAPAPDIVIDGRPGEVRRVKLLELASLLSLHPGGLSRERMQESLFPDSDQRRGGNHFRQVVHQLRKLTGVTLQRLANGHVSWSDGFDVEARDVRFERSWDESRAVAGPDRLERIRVALALATGPYLPASNLEWVGDRRFHLELLQEEAQNEAARLSLELGDLPYARACAESVIERNPSSDEAYRVIIEVELAIGTEAAAHAAYRRGVQARRDIGLEPDPVAAALLQPRATR